MRLGRGHGMVAKLDFSGLVGSLGIRTGIAIEGRLCPDQYIGRLGDLGLAGAMSHRFAADSRPRGGGLLVVLESPHIEEFRGEPAPARGRTGRNIAKYLGQVAPAGVGPDSPVVLVNAIQLQCSLGFPTECFRDKVFTAVWNSGGRADFVDRLRRLSRPRDLVLCCCTKGASQKPVAHLRQLVYTAICETLPTVTCSRRTHPAAWHKPELRDYEW